MLKVSKILVTTLALAGGTAVLSACGQKGPLIMPSTPESVGRATLVEALNPWHQKPAVTPAPPARPVAPSLESPDQLPATPIDLPVIPPRAP